MSTIIDTINCPICAVAICDSEKHVRYESKIHEYDCPRCGTFQLSPRAQAFLTNMESAYSKEQRLSLSNAARKHWEFEKQPLRFTGDSLNLYDNQISFVDPVTQSETLMLWIGSHHTSSSSGCLIAKAAYLEAVIDAKNWNDVVYLLDQLSQQGLVTKRNASTHEIVVNLTFSGWQKYKELSAGKTKSNRVFMAMRFGNSDLDRLFKEYYKPTLENLGYDLFRLDDEPKAGSITNRMRIAIKESKFVIADLSHGNRGAYWEAGFGEGLGKHVIYSVNKSTLGDDHHFDVQGQQAVIWTTDNMEKAASDLEACVKATFY